MTCTWKRIANRQFQRSLAKDDRGAVAVIFALALPAVLGFGAIAVDGSNLYVNRNLLQTAADAAARAAVEAIPDATQVRETATYYAGRNMPEAQYGPILHDADVRLGEWTAENRTFVAMADGSAINAVQVRTHRHVPLFLAGLWGDGTSTVSATATAALVSEPGNYCILALGSSAENIAFQGGNQLQVDSAGCSAASNSTADSSMRVTGQPANVTLESFDTVGGVIEQDLEKINLLNPPRVRRPQPFADPYADFAVPSGLVWRDVPSQQGNQDITMQPGIYSDPISFSGNFDVTLESGVYVFDNGLNLGGSVTVQGDDVTIIVRGDVDIDDTSEELTFPGNITVDINAPTEGDTAGLAIVGIGKVDIRMQGTPEIAVDGAIYTPEGHINFAGNPGAAGCLNLIGYSVAMVGSSSFANNCEDQGTRPIMTTRAALVD